MALRLDNAFKDENYKVVLNNNEVGKQVNGIKYYRHKPNLFMALFRKTIEAEVGGTKVFLKKKSAETYVNQHVSLNDVKKHYSKDELKAKLAEIFKNKGSESDNEFTPNPLYQKDIAHGENPLHQER